MKHTLLSLSVIAIPLCTVAAVVAEESEAKNQALETLTITGDKSARMALPGSAHALDRRALEEFRYSDIHRVLENVPGVYIREEDGYGLRPNIGMRGATANRSRKIALMEDGILIAPAPYAAPSAYYFPQLSRMQSIEVFKGPVAIEHGPNTVGGALNLLSRDIPNEDDIKGQIDVSIGEDNLRRLHGYYGASSDTFGWLLEAIHTQTEGFKELDGPGDDTGFEKSDIMAKFRFNSDASADIYHQWDIKLLYADEEANETYLGLAERDFDDNPNRRYLASGNDRLEMDHQHISIAHFVALPNDINLSTTLYYNQLSRVWGRVNGFQAVGFNTILDDPTSAANRRFYDVLTGASDTINSDETLQFNRNKREFSAQGIQFAATTYQQWGSYFHDLKIGVRYHEDEVKRDHTVEGLLVQNGELVANGAGQSPTTVNTGKAEAFAFYLHDKITLNQWTLSAGVRVEDIDTELLDRTDGSRNTNSETSVIPGAGLTYRVAKNLTLIGGVHKGFIPVSPGSDDDVDPEESINYELGFRYGDAQHYAEVIGFFNDYSNLKGTCSFASGCQSANLDNDFNGGEVDVYGVEMLYETRFGNSDASLSFPLNIVYTFTQSEFKNSFTSDNPEFAVVRSGFELPYIPEHQLLIKTGIHHYDWQANISMRYTSEMRDTAGEGTINSDEGTDSRTVVDFAGKYRLGDKSEVYLLVDNLFDEESIASRRPFGIRPGKPRTLTIGYQYSIY